MPSSSWKMNNNGQLVSGWRLSLVSGGVLRQRDVKHFPEHLNNRSSPKLEIRCCIYSTVPTVNPSGSSWRGHSTAWPNKQVYQTVSIWEEATGAHIAPLDTLLFHRCSLIPKLFDKGSRRGSDDCHCIQQVAAGSVSPKLITLFYRGMSGDTPCITDLQQDFTGLWNVCITDLQQIFTRIWKSHSANAPQMTYMYYQEAFGSEGALKNKRGKNVGILGSQGPSCSETGWNVQLLCQ